MKAIYAGSFDPITLGHVSVIERAFKLFQQVHIVVANNRSKNHLFTLEQRTELVERSIPSLYANRTVIMPFEGIVADYINENRIDAVIRGIRNATDLEYELQLEQYIRNTTAAETVYLSPYTQHMQTNSSLVRMFFQSGKHELASHYMSPDAYQLALLYELGAR
ncbi:Phosphopantetheine adenylyltransferase [Paenibacillus plantiphilus]|uniref:Phosphopantetheine adenylyltransferase n=1 Tax=Paenibacillus plantiphilus TaxID=2905650 RepID=A0ABN8GPW7_9BACL|nr:pantetheine-phosphate adenylyltransferase [Paenibacillus plantiphilus]CAH1210701.1 Phosphopantetheine adenylyltransferase [Paenibacillus plantiphilus]